MCHGLSWVGKDPIISTPRNLFLIKDKPAAAERKEKGRNEALAEGNLSLNPSGLYLLLKEIQVG